MSGFLRPQAQLTRLILASLVTLGLIIWTCQRYGASFDRPFVQVVGDLTAGKSVESSSTYVSSASPVQPTSAGTSSPSGFDGPALAPSENINNKVWSRVGKVSTLYYDTVTSDTQAYERALLSHIRHDERFGYSHFILRRGVIDGIWTKLALLLHQLVQELAKPPAERLDWLFWHDADLVLVNDQMPLEAFLPPEPRWSHINFMAANDLSGLNAGVLFLRVCEWSVHFISAGLSYPVYKPDVHLRYDEQTALEFLIQEERWGNNTMHVPQRWFNAYHHFGRDDDIPPEWNWTNGYHEPGDLLVHLPGTGTYRSQLIDEWLGKIRSENDKYSVALTDTNYPEEIKSFWEGDAETEAERQTTFWRRWKLLQEVGRQEDDKTRDLVEEAKKTMNGTKDDEIEKAVEAIKEERKKGKIEALRKAEEDTIKEESESESKEEKNNEEKNEEDKKGEDSKED
ncbi:hypothetical protein F5884DRAFT_444965 [Xylogone sp. PMI_703]|nr:hypothetical protein F5884DRAFT_444965 [Xylogone sp. PMI_703]